MLCGNKIVVGQNVRINRDIARTVWSYYLHRRCLTSQMAYSIRSSVGPGVYDSCIMAACRRALLLSIWSSIRFITTPSTNANCRLGSDAVAAAKLFRDYVMLRESGLMTRE